MKLLKTFRRHRKVAFALLTLMAMISFVILPIILDMIQGSGGGNPVVVETTGYGPLRQNEMRSLTYQRQKVIALLQLIHERVARSSPPPFPGREPMTQAAMVLRQLGSADEEAVAQTWLLTKRAEEIGIQVSDQTISGFIAQVTEGKVTEKVFRDIVRELQLTETILFECLRHELLALRLEELFSVSLVGMPPAQNWEFFLRMNRKAKIEAVPVQVADFIAQTPDPSDAQIDDLFNKYKNRDPNPNSPEPGFREPHRVAIEYFRAEYSRFLDPTKVTEDEIKKYYDENKDFEFVDRDEKPAAKPETKPEAKPEAKPPAKPAAEKPEPSGPKPAETKAEASKPAEGPAPPAPVEKPAATEPAPPGKKTSAAAPRRPFRLASYQAKEAVTEKPPATPEAKPEAKSDAKPEAKPAPTPEKAKPPTKPQPKEEAKPETPDAKPAETKPAPKPVKHKPLDQVRDQIRMTLARRQAEQKAEEVLGQLEKPLREYELKWLEHARKQKTAATPPERPRFKELAAQHGIAANETGLITIWDVDRFDIARSWIDGARPFKEVALGPLNLFQRIKSKDPEGAASYLFWKVEDKPERDVTLDDPGVRERVVEAFKLREARALARAEAERMADEARKADKSLKQVFGARGKKVVEPEPFTWMTYGILSATQVGARLNEVSGIELAGGEFMKAVFGLEPGRFGVAMNFPETVVYVVRLIEYTPPADELWNDFIKDGRGLGDSSLVARGAIQDAQIAWMEELRTQAGFRWVEEPRRRTER